MLFKLQGVVEFNAAIRPICLPEQLDLSTEDAIVSGWGRTANGTTSDVLMKVTLELFSNSECSHKYEAYTEFTKGIEEYTQMCAGWMNGNIRKDACQVQNLFDFLHPTFLYVSCFLCRGIPVVLSKPIRTIKVAFTPSLE